MKKETFAAVATLATTMFMAQGTFGQAQSSERNRSADTSSQTDQNRSSRDSSCCRSRARRRSTCFSSR